MISFPSRPTHAVALGAAALFVVPFGGLVYGPEPGASDTQYWTVSHTLELQDIEVELSNEDAVDVPEIQMSAVHTTTLALEQVHLASADGAPSKLRRSFVEVGESIEGEFSIPSESVAETLEAAVELDLEDRTVLFERSKGEWERSYVDDEGEEATGPKEVLGGLSADSDLGGLLAGLDNAQEGASWTADASTLVALVAPGGNLGGSVEVSSDVERGMEPVLAGLDPLLGMDLHLLLAGDADGSIDGGIECRVESMDDAEAVIVIQVDVTANRDVTERVRGWMEGFEAPMEVEVASANAELAATGKGKVTWNIEAGLPSAAELELELTYRIERKANLQMPGDGDVVLTSIFDLAGSLKSEMSAE